MFRKLLTGKGSMYSEDYEAVSAIKKIADAHHVPILIIHHLKKGMEGDWLSEISGSQGIAGAADTIFSLKRERNSSLATLHRTGRDVEERDFIMKLDGFGWTLQDDAEAFTMPEWKRQILDFLKSNPSVTPVQLSEATSIPLNTAQQHLRRLAKEGAIKKTGYGTRLRTKTERQAGNFLFGVFFCGLDWSGLISITYRVFLSLLSLFSIHACLWCSFCPSRCPCLSLCSVHAGL